MQTKAENIYAIGDVVGGTMTACKALAQGIHVAQSLGGSPIKLSPTMPHFVYTSPELAYIGKSEEQLKQEGTQYTVGQFPFAANGRMITSGTSPDGFAKILKSVDTQQILGAWIVGPNATEMISEASIAMQSQTPATEIGGAWHAHPTYSEVFK